MTDAFVCKCLKSKKVSFFDSPSFLWLHEEMSMVES